MLVRVLQRLEELTHDAHDVVHREALVRFEVALQLAPLHELHRDVVRAGVLAEVVDPDDVRMGEPARRLGLAAEARELLLRILALQILGADRLERDDPVDHRVVTLVHDPHRTLAELAADLESSELRDFTHARRRCDSVRVGTGYLYLLSISQTDFCTSRCTMVSRPTPPCCDCENPITEVPVAPISIFSSV